MPVRSTAPLDFLSPLSVVPGLGPRRVAALGEAGISTAGDLLYYFPRRYVDRSTIVPLAEVPQHLDKEVALIATITRTRVERGRRPRLRILLDDGTGTLEAVWFAGVPYLRASLKTGMRVLVSGKVSRYTTLQMVHPLIETIGADRAAPEVPFLPQYRVTLAMKEAGLGQRGLQQAVRWLIRSIQHYPSVLPRQIVERRSFPPLEECIERIHLPQNPADLERHRGRMRYEDLYTLCLSLYWNRRRFAMPGRRMRPGDLYERLLQALPYQLTAEQRSAVSTLHGDAASERRMHRLLQGDVGSGKTVVAFSACLPALASGCQVAWLTPTEVLALQTHRVVSAWLKPLGLSAALLKGGDSITQRRDLLAGLADGSVRFVVGTHALLQPAIRFNRPGMFVIDEQHRFGVEQRLALQGKGAAADFLLMSATPIPQTLAQTLYADLDVVTIRGVLPGRSAVETHVVPQPKRAAMERFVVEQIDNAGAQVYWIVPRVEAGEDEESDIKDVQTTFSSLRRGLFRDVPCALVHGGVEATEKDRVLTAFGHGQVKLLVATTVVEVGIDAPGATVIVIENAERFGLSELHQLRGRVGRGERQSWCFLLCEAGTEAPAHERLQHFCRLHDGFTIAETDLKLRGPGQVTGAEQSGWDDRRMRDILSDLGLFAEVKREVEELLREAKPGACASPPR
jgi:ATP-dependent DNA helicase RecG